MGTLFSLNGREKENAAMLENLLEVNQMLTAKAEKQRYENKLALKTADMMLPMLVMIVQTGLIFCIVALNFLRYMNGLI
jgi:hypothetical protein